MSSGNILVHSCCIQFYGAFLLRFCKFWKIDWLPKKQIGYWCGVCKVVYVMFAVVGYLSQLGIPPKSLMLSLEI